MEFEERFKLFKQKMSAAGLPGLVIENFRFYYRELVEGKTGRIPEDDIEPIEAVPDAEHFGEDLAQAGRQALDQAVTIKLNGGLGTSMGLDKAKSLLKVKGELSFLDIIARQALKSGFPLVLMNSFATREDSRRSLERYRGISKELPLDFVQNKIPKVRRQDLRPAEYSPDPELEWCPPGHGDIYTALITSGMLDSILSREYRYAFISNCDNLGAVLDGKILGHFIANGLPFMMEVADRTENDRKGGHIARSSKNGEYLLLRESAQCPDEDLEAFQDISRHRYFNTNNLWIDLEQLRGELRRRPIRLPMIRNEKPVNPRDPDSTPVYQLETAMGAAISIFEGAGVVRVPRSRFAPVKTTEDLLQVRSDLTVLGEDWQIRPNPDRRYPSVRIELDDRYYRMVADMEERFPEAPPSLKECREFRVEGDVLFESNVKLLGDVRVINRSSKRQVVPADSRLRGVHSCDP